MIEQSAKGHSCTVGSIHIMCQQLLSTQVFIGQSHTNQISNASVTYPLLTRPGTDIDQTRVQCQDVAIWWRCFNNDDIDLGKKWWSRRWSGLECKESIDGWEAKEAAALQRIRHHLSRDESTFNLKQVCDQRNLEDSFIGILVGRLGGRLSWVFCCFRTEPFLTFLLFALS